MINSKNASHWSVDNVYRGYIWDNVKLWILSTNNFLFKTHTWHALVKDHVPLGVFDISIIKISTLFEKFILIKPFLTMSISIRCFKYINIDKELLTK